MSNVLAFKIEDAKDGYVYDPKTRTYTNVGTGEEVDQDILKLLYEDLVESVRSEMLRSTRAMMREDISLVDWQLEIADLIKNINLVAISMAQGGWDNLNQSDLGYIGNQIKKQYKYLQLFANQIESSEQLLNDGLLVRMSLYADSSYLILQDALRRSAKANGLKEERRILGGSRESCEDCIHEANKDWSKIGSLRKIGDSACKMQCHCSFEYR